MTTATVNGAILKNVIYKRFLFATLLLLLPVAGCSDRPQIWSEPLRMLGPHRIDQQVMWVDATRGLVFALDPNASGGPQVRSLAVPRNATFTQPSPSGEQLLILTGGKEALRTDQQPEQPALVVVRVASAGGAPEIAARYDLPSAFDRLAVSSDGRWAVAYYGETQSQQGSNGAVFRNPNEVALLDLTTPAGANNPMLHTLRSFGSAPLGVVFSPALALPAAGDEQRTLAIVVSQNYLTFLDMNHRERREITVPLVPQDSDVTVVPRQVLFRSQPPMVFVRADGSPDLYTLSLEPRTPAQDGGNDYRPLINQPSAGGRTVRDMVLLTEGDRTLILAATASQDLALIDSATSEHAIITVGEPIDTILPIPADQPTLALVYSRGAPRNRLHFLELDKLSERLANNLSHRTLARPVHDVLAVPGNEQALVVHDSARTVVSILDLVGEHRTDTPIQGQLALDSFDFVGGRYLVGVAKGLRRLGVLDLQTLHPRDLRLDHDPARVLVVGETLVVDHGAAPGLVTVVPRPDAAREDAQVLWGMFFNGLLDQNLHD